MSDSPYIYPALTATRDGVPEPAVEVDLALSRLQEVLESPLDSAADAYDLLAAWAWLQRVRPELLAALHGNHDMARAADVIQRNSVALAELALSFPNPDAWLRAAEAFVAQLEVPSDAADDGAQAGQLIADLDDAQLMLSAVRRGGGEDPELSAQLEECDAWLARHADVFLAASVYVQAVGMALRPDLEQLDYELASTAIKFRDLLDAAQAAEEELLLTGIKPWPAEYVNRLARERRRRRKVQVFSTWRDAWRKSAEAVPLAAAAPRLATPETLNFYWQSPGGEFLARLIVAAPAGPAAKPEPLKVAFFTPDHQGAGSLVGQPVWLGGVASQIDAHGRAVFAALDVLASDKELKLEFGAGREPWMLDEN